MWRHAKAVNRLFTILRQSGSVAHYTSPLTPELWLLDMFACKAVQRGEVIRRKARDIEQFVGMDLFRTELRRRRFRAVGNAGQIIVFCNQQAVRAVV